MTRNAVRLPLPRDREGLARALGALRERVGAVGLVPTMGALHGGHRSLVERCREVADATVVSVFVNPLQFGPEEDLERYPRDLDRDVELAARWGADLLFAPEESVVYPDGPPVVYVTPGRLGERLCGAFRPGHFRGVLTVVAKLLGLVRPDVAVFGRKDYQQVVLIRRMVRELELGVRVETVPLVREADGLAMSSRNAYLSPEDRERALGLFRALSAADGAFRAGEHRPASLVQRMREVVAEHPGLRLQYAELVEPETLAPPDRARAGQVLAVAGFAGATRLIDNLVLGSDRPDPRLAPGDGEEGGA